MNILLSFPRSGSHLCRFFIELLSEKPTFGCKPNGDIEIYKNKFRREIPFNISTYEKDKCYFKYHYPPSSTKCHNEHIGIHEKYDIRKLIVIIRNPKEVLLRHHGYKLCLDKYNGYFDTIDFYNNFTGDKLLLFYEDILTNKLKFINELYNFLDIDNEDKKKYVIDNIDELYSLSLNGKNRDWGGNRSNGQLNFYYKKIPAGIKKSFDNYINNKFNKYPLLKEKYC